MKARTQKKPSGAPQERILQVASDLFYRQGYRRTGVNEVIQKSGVAKATFYNHFPTKEDLGVAYLRLELEREITHVESFIQDAGGPLERFLAVIRSLIPWMQETDCRGCPFMNMASEVPDPESPLRAVGKATYDYVRGRLQTLSDELIASDTARYGHLDAGALTGDYMSTLAGAIALAEVYHSIRPIEDAMRSIGRLIGEKVE